MMRHNDAIPDKTTATGAAWLSVAGAAAALNVSPKTVWRRARAGELTARKVAGARGAKVWEVCLDSSGQTMRPSGQTQTANQTAKRTQSPENEHEASGQTKRTPNGQAAKASGQSDATGQREIETELRDQLAREREQNQFLRGLVEQRDRDAAELRASLREALRAMPRQLPAPPEAAQIASANRVPSVAPDAVKSPAKREGGLTYSEIADELERGLNR